MNAAAKPSVTAPPAVTETVSVPASAIVAVAAAGEPTVTVPADVLAFVSVTDSVSFGSSTASAVVGIAIVPLEAPASSVSITPGAV